MYEKYLLLKIKKKKKFDKIKRKSKGNITYTFEEIFRRKYGKKLFKNVKEV